MTSIISLSWQLEINDCPIPNTIIKNRCQQPHHYFYSSKQNRILRKKTPNISSLISQSQSKKNPSKLLKIFKNTKNKLIQFQFCQGCSTITDLDDYQFQGQFCIIQSNYQLCRVMTKYKGNYQEIQVEYLTCSKPFPDKQKQIRLFMQSLMKSIIFGMSKKMSELKLSKHLPSENKITLIQLIIALNYNIESSKANEILIIQGTNLKFSNKQLSMYQIQFQSLLSKQHPIFQKQKLIKQNYSIQKKQNINHNQQNQHITKQISKIIKKQSSISIPTVIQQKIVIKCQCCSTDIQLQNCKQITSEEIISLRKLSKLSIRGFNEQYYHVCYDCYMKL